MEFSIVSSDLTIKEIHPSVDLQEYTRRVEQDCKTYFAQLEAANCPACDSSAVEKSWTRFGISFAKCNHCGSIYGNRRPAEKDLAKFYRESSARQYWHETIWPHSEETRIQKVIRPFLDWVENSLSANAQVGEWRATHSGFALEAKRRFQEFATVDSYTLGWTSSELPTVALDALIAIDLFDRASHLTSTLRQAHASLKADGLIFTTCTLSTGFDVMALEEKHPGLYPPDRLNCLSYEGAIALFEREGFEIVEFSTPGVLDVATVVTATNQISDASNAGLSAMALPAWLKYWFTKRDNENLTEDLQAFLQAHRLSSKARIQLRKKGN